MSISPQDLINLSSKQLRDKYTRKQINDTKSIINRIGEKEYINSFSALGEPDPGKMDVFSREYLSTVGKNFVPSVQNTFTGFL